MMGYNVYMMLGGWRFLKKHNCSFIKCDDRQLILEIHKNVFINQVEIYKCDGLYVMKFYKGKNLVNRFDDLLDDQLIDTFNIQIEMKLRRVV